MTLAAVPTAIAVLLAAASPAPSGFEPPFVRLFDTGTAAAKPLPPGALAKRGGWAAVKEGDTKHTFAGDAVFANDKLAVVLRRKGARAELYARADDGWQKRSVLAPCAAPGDPAARLVSLRIVANGPGAVTLEATFQTRGGKQATGRFRLTTGVPVVEFRPSSGTAALQVRDDIRHVVVPELFANDVVLSPDAAAHPRVGIPAENMLLALLGTDEAMGVCVWRSVEQNADALAAGQPRGRTIRACEIESSRDAPVWYALLEAKGMWHDRAIAAGDAGKQTVLDWKPPFAAKWRGDFVGPDGETVSRDVRDVPAGAAPAAAGPDPGPDCFFRSGSAILDLRAARASPAASPEMLVVYPIDRASKTPLTAFCPIDVMRNALGTGVCEYVLAAEGLGSSAEATPEQVARWLERTFARKRDRQQAEAIQRRLEALAQFLRRADARSEAYTAAALRIWKRCEAVTGDKSCIAAARAIGALVDPMARTAALHEILRGPGDRGGGDTKRPDWHEWSFLGKIIALGIANEIGKPTAAKRVSGHIGFLREAGRNLNANLAWKRQTLRRVRQLCRTTAANEPPAADFAREIQKLADAALRRPAAKER